MKKFFLSLILLPLFTSCLLSQGGAAAPFLYINPSPANNSLGGAGIANTCSNPLSMYDNSAIIGFNAKTNNLAIEFYPVATGLLFSGTYSAFGFYIGHNYGKDSNSLPLSLGAGFYRTSADLGEFIRTDVYGKVMGKFTAFEAANNFTIGAMLDYWLQVGFGFTYKMVYSELENMNLQSGVNGKGHLFDVGLLINAPILESNKISKVLDLDLDISLGLNIANFGSKMEYDYESDPFSTSSNVGYTIRTGIDWNVLKSKFNAVDLIWSVQCDNLLLSKDSLGSNFRTVYSGIRPIDNMILLNTSGDMIIRYGAMLKIMDIGYIAAGASSNGTYFMGIEDNSTFGFGVRSEGIIKIINSFADSSFLKFIADHVDIAYQYANNEQGSALVKWTYSSIGIRFHDYMF